MFQGMVSGCCLPTRNCFCRFQISRGSATQASSSYAMSSTHQKTTSIGSALDIDLAVESIRNPAAFPLIAKPGSPDRAKHRDS